VACSVVLICCRCHFDAYNYSDLTELAAIKNSLRSAVLLLHAQRKAKTPSVDKPDKLRIVDDDDDEDEDEDEDDDNNNNNNADDNEQLQDNPTQQQQQQQPTHQPPQPVIRMFGDNTSLTAPATQVSITPLVDTVVPTPPAASITSSSATIEQSVATPQHEQPDPVPSSSPSSSPVATPQQEQPDRCITTNAPTSPKNNSEQQQQQQESL
jgi:hypothetical protein